jgi:glutathione S-transferase
MDAWIRECGGYIASPTISIADVVGIFELSHAVMLLGLNIAEYPDLAAWYTIMISLDGVEQRIAPLRENAAKVARPIIYGFNLSPHSMSIRALANLLGIKHNYIEIDCFSGAQKTPTVTSLNKG